MSTIKEVASAAGVSVGTVSNVLNDYEHVTEVKRKKVLDAVDILGYKPNSIARTLKTKISKNIGLIVPDISNPFYAELARGAEDALRQYGYNLFLCNNDRNSEKEADYVDALIDKSADGIIIVKPTISETKIHGIGKNNNLVLLDTDMPVSKDYAIINADDYMSAYKMTEYLYQMKHRKIAYFSGNMDARSDHLRFQGYKSFMEKHGLFEENLVEKCGVYSISESYNHARNFLRQKRKINAVFASNDVIALGIIHAANDLGILVPEDISVAGCDDIEMSSYLRPTLTTIRRPKYLFGNTAAKVLIDTLVYGKSIRSLTMTLSAEQITRDSVIKKSSKRLNNPIGGPRPHIRVNNSRT
jgi:LacI family transcriptional regulator